MSYTKNQKYIIRINSIERWNYMPKIDNMLAILWMLRSGKKLLQNKFQKS